MRGSIKWQANELFHQSGINQIGTSKHEAKEAARQGGGRTWQEVGRNLGIHSHSTANSYRDVWRAVLGHSRELYGVKDIEKITDEHITSYLKSKIEARVSHSTFLQYAAACQKLEQALNSYSEKFGRSNEYHFSSAISAQRAVAREVLERFSGSRTYEDPRSLISAISSPDYKLAAQIQLESGGRLHEVSLIKAGQLKGLNEDRITGELRGTICVQAKGGKIVNLMVTRNTYARLEHRVEECGGAFRISKGGYRSSLAAAAASSGQEYQGSHGLRWNFAHERVAIVQDAGGKSYESALSETSRDMGHERADITEHYLK